ncbi:hypothetical protein [Pseudomonas fluorescens]|uniref:Uncharacterized protein n=1 Tax=Pseudomonas fluorescens TaxID=294 RepID=A0A5E6WLX6_PSEFL|nr:hypothetical protein [Pseudomonas fluorescens]VVN29683.1 hypothetical protein PS659_04809 [Pseudomonas fluorescens]
MTTQSNATTTAASPWEQANLFINGMKVEWGTKPLLIRGEENSVTVEAPDEVARELNLVLSEDGGLNIVASPTFGNWVARVDGKFEWKINPDADKSGRITLVFFSREVLESWEHQSLVMSSNLADEVEVKIGGVSVPSAGSVFFRGQAKDVELIPKPGSPIDGHPIALTRTAKSPLQHNDLSSAPRFDPFQTTHKWRVTGANRSGTFELHMTGQGMTTRINVTANKLLSTNLADEVEVNVGGENVPSAGSVFFRGQAKDVELIPKPGSPIAGHPIALTRTAKSPLQHNDLSSAPRFDPFQTTHKWRVTGANRSGIFELHMTGQGMTTRINVTANKLLSSNLADEADVKIDGVAVPAEGNVFYRDKPKTVTLTPKPDSPLGGLPIKLNCVVKSGLDPANVVSDPHFGEEQTIYSWTVTGNTKSGTFQLSLLGAGMSMPMILPVSRLIAFPQILFAEAPIYYGSIAEAAKKGIHRIKINEREGKFRDSRVRLILLNAGSNNRLIPESGEWLPPDRKAAWELVCGDSDADMRLLVEFEGVDDYNMSFPVRLTRHTRAISALFPSTDKFIANQLGYYYALFVSAKNPAIRMKVEDFRYMFAGIPIRGETDDFLCLGMVPVKLPAGTYNFTCFIRLPDGSREDEKSASFTVHSG